MKNKIKIIIALICIIIFLGILLGIKVLLPGYKNTDITDKTNLVINNSNVTNNLKQNNTDVYISENKTIYMSIIDIKNFFDRYIYIDENYNQIISTYNSNIMALKINSTSIKINGIESKINSKTIERNGILYLPFSEIQNVYNANVKYVSDTDTVIIDTNDRDKKIAKINTNSTLKSRGRNLSRTIEKLKKGENVVIIGEYNNWMQIRSESGKIGFVNSKHLSDIEEIKSTISKENQINGKINLVWDYFYNEEAIPNRNNEFIQGINIVSPSFFILNENEEGSVITHIGESGKQYIEWAHRNKYKVWAMISNNSNKELTSKIMRDYQLREKLISNIVELVKTYEIDGINVDFENMYKEDKKFFSRFIIELKPRLSSIEKTISVDVTAPDGDDSWSMCYERNVIGNVADYIIFMAYDQYGEASTVPGTTSGYGWVKINLNKFIETEEIPSEKIILGLPFYSRIWISKDNKLIKSTPVAMKHIYSNIPKETEIKWDDITNQNYVKYEQNGYIKEIWIEDIKSYTEKLSLVNSYKLGGVANWCKDMESPEIWGIIEKELTDK